MYVKKVDKNPNTPSEVSIFTKSDIFKGSIENRCKALEYLLNNNKINESTLELVVDINNSRLNEVLLRNKNTPENILEMLK